MPEQVVPMGMRGEPGDHRNAEPVHVIGELVQIGTVDAGIDQDQPTLPAHHDGIGTTMALAPRWHWHHDGIGTTMALAPRWHWDRKGVGKGKAVEPGAHW